MAANLGGDETGAIVGDVGSWSSKFGFAGEDVPKCVLMSRVFTEEAWVEVKHEDDLDLTKPSMYELPPNYPVEAPRPAPPKSRVFCDVIPWSRPGVLAEPLKQGNLHDWDAVEYLWQEALSRLKSSAKEHPLLCAMPPWTKPEAQERYLEFFFESLETPAAFMSRSSSLAAFASGRASALVVDCGAGSSSASPVVDGYVLLRATKKSTICGDYLDTKLVQSLSEGGVTPRVVARARRLNKDFEIHESLRSYAELEAAREVKEWLRLDGKTPSPQEDDVELPDGTRLQAHAFRPVPELLFSQEQQPTLGLQTLVRSALHDADVDVRKDLLQSIVVCGGGSLFPGLAERLHHELNANLASTFKTKLIVPSKIERRFATWIGGSVLASLGSFQQQWLSRAEYFEDGPLGAQERWN